MANKEINSDVKLPAALEVYRRLFQRYIKTLSRWKRRNTQSDVGSGMKKGMNKELKKEYQWRRIPMFSTDGQARSRTR